MPRRSASLLVLLLSTLVWLAPSPANATYFGPQGPKPWWYADNSYHYFFFNNLTTTYLGPSNWSINNNISPTNMQGYLASSNATADVRVYDAFYGTDMDPVWVGLTDCVTSAGYPKCDVFRVRYNQSVYEPSPRHLACHEFGHTAGLQHPTEEQAATYYTCMQDPAGTYFAPHENDHINGYYPRVGASGAKATVPVNPVNEVGEVNTTQLPPTGSPEARGMASEPFDFSSLDEMVATSAAVVVGTVTEVAPGESHGDVLDSIELERVTIQVTEVVDGTYTATTLTLNQQTNPPIIDPLKPGDEGMYFLYQWEDGRYGLINSEGRVLFNQSVLVPSNPADDWAQAIEQMTLAEFRSALATSVEHAESGQVPAQAAPEFCCEE